MVHKVVRSSDDVNRPVWGVRFLQTFGRGADFRAIRRAALACGAAGAFLLAAAAPASAVSGPFCPPTRAGNIGLRGGARCVHVYHNRNAIIDYMNVLTPVRKCAILKPNPNGSGGNVGGVTAACAPAMEIATQFYPPPGPSGYATGLNDSSNYHTGFKGLLTLY